MKTSRRAKSEFSRVAERHKPDTRTKYSTN